MFGWWTVPKRFETKYKPEMDDVVIREMSEGASKTEVCAEIGITRETFNQWTNPESQYYKPSLSDALKIGVELSKAWWLKSGRTNLENKDFSYTGWYMNMKNRFKWSDNQNLKHTGPEGGPIKHQWAGGPAPMTIAEWERQCQEADEGGDD